MDMSSYRQLFDWTIEQACAGNWNDAYDELKSLESNGNAAATAVLARLYLQGLGVDKNIEFATELFEKAINLGCGEAAWELGMQYYCGNLELPLDSNKAISIFEKGARVGEPQCIGVLAHCYLFGDSVAEDHSKAFDYATRAAKMGDIKSLRLVALCYERGLGTNRDAGLAYIWYKEYLKYKPEDDNVMLSIALCLADPYKRFEINPTREMLNEAFFYVVKAIEKGNAEAHLIAGWFYEKGEVVPLDFNVAHKYIQIAAEKGEDFAQRHLDMFKKDEHGNYYLSI